MARVAVTLTFCGFLFVAALAVSQTAPARSGVRLAPHVLDALEAALPSPAEFSSRMWEGRGPNENISRSNFEERYGRAKTAYRHDAQVQLQQVTELLDQMNTIENLTLCADNAKQKLVELSTNSLNSTLSWSGLSSSWTSISDYPCISGDVLMRSVQDPDVRTSLERVLAKVRRATADLTAAIRTEDRTGLVCSAKTLANQMSLYYLVMAVQVTSLSRDLHELVPTMGVATQPSSDLLERLQQILKEPSDN